MLKLNSVEGCGDETVWAANLLGSNATVRCYFTSINFASEKHNIGFTHEPTGGRGKQFPRSERDVASDFFALRKHYTGSKWLFTESVNCLNAASHCDIAWRAGWRRRRIGATPTAAGWWGEARFTERTEEDGGFPANHTKNANEGKGMRKSIGPADLMGSIATIRRLFQ